MSARVCQLCGKPLSRFSVGSGGDFCSREHRNQYRLRIGMDRLEEANKVASLMRRRENAKQLPAARLIADSACNPRPCPPQRIHSTRLEPILPPVRNAAQSLMFRPAMNTRTHFAGAHRPGTPQPRLEECPILPSAAVAALKPQKPHIYASISQAHVALLRYHVFGNTPDRKEFGILRDQRARFHLSTRPEKQRSVGRTKSDLAREPLTIRPFHPEPSKGRPLRISGGAGFRIPPPMRPTFALLATDGVAQLRVERPRHLAATARTRAGVPRSVTIPGRIPELPYKTPSLDSTITALPTADSPARVKLRPSRGQALEPRVSATSWNPAMAIFDRLQELRNGIGFRHRSAGGVARRLPASAIESIHRVSEVSFDLQAPPFEFGSVLHGSLPVVPFGGVTLTAKRFRGPSAIEEHFDKGMSNWTTAADWKLDAAGVRTGSLSLLKSSMELTDYTLEFLARIENGGVQWVFRAMGLQDYFQARLEVRPGGAYQFCRFAVTGGIPEPAVVVPVRPASGGGALQTAKSAVTVRMHARGSEFTVYLDGRVVDAWTDPRFPTGGIGFVGKPDDRARLYWVNLTPAGNPGKENWKQ